MGRTHEQVMFSSPTYEGWKKQLYRYFFEPPINDRFPRDNDKANVKIWDRKKRRYMPDYEYRFNNGRHRLVVLIGTDEITAD